MASFDVESLFNNIPLQETINICIDQLFSNSRLVLNLTQNLFKQLLSHTVNNTFFLFNNILYQQTEGLGMGLPLGPTFANIFMTYHEKIWLRDCPNTFKPIFYRRYIDDTFLLFRNQSHVNKFLEYLNSKHPNIKFTHETENNGTLNFLDITISRQNNTFSCSIYRKPTFTGLDTSFFSFCTIRFKFAAIQTLIHRAYNICSTYHSINTEFEFLKNFFKNNGYQTTLVENFINRFLYKVRTPKTPIFDVPKKVMYFKIPFFGHQSEKMKTELVNTLSKIYPFVDFRLILVNPLKISSFFRFKDRLPKSISASLVYEYSCALGSASVSYIGCTKRHLFQRVAEHAGCSARSGNPLSQPLYSSIRNHCNKCTCSISIDKFKILGSTSNDFDLKILESLFIHKKRPQLNDQQSSLPLLIV